MVVPTLHAARARPAAPVRRFPAAVLALLLSASAPVAADFRGFAWGSPPTAITSGEPGELVAGMPSQLIYRAELGDIQTLLTYRFPEGRLVQARHLNRSRHDDRGRYIADYGRLKAWLEARHGKPRTDTVTWGNDLFRDDPARHGDAIAAGHAVHYARWVTDETEIVMTLHGERYQVVHEVVFTEAASAGESAAAP